MIKHYDKILEVRSVDMILSIVNCKGNITIGYPKKLRDRFVGYYTQYKKFCVSSNFSDTMMGMTQIIECRSKSGKDYLFANLFSEYTEANIDGDSIDIVSLKMSLIHLKNICESTLFCTRYNYWKLGMIEDFGYTLDKTKKIDIERVLYNVFGESRFVELGIYKNIEKRSDVNEW